MERIFEKMKWVLIFAEQLPSGNGSSYRQPHNDMEGKENGHMELDSFCRLYGERVRFVKLALSYLHDADEAEDVVADIFSGLWERREQVRGSYEVQKSYVYTIVRHRCVDIIRRNLRKKDIHDRLYRNIADEEIRVLENDDVIGTVFANEVARLIGGAGELVDERSMRIFSDSRLGGLTYKEIARKYNMTFDQVAKSISRTLSVFSKVLKDYLPFLVLMMLHRN